MKWEEGITSSSQKEEVKTHPAKYCFSSTTEGKNRGTTNTGESLSFGSANSASVKWISLKSRKKTQSKQKQQKSLGRSFLYLISDFTEIPECEQD